MRSLAFSNPSFLFQNQAANEAADRVQEGEHVKYPQRTRDNSLEVVRLECCSRHQAYGCHDIYCNLGATYTRQTLRKDELINLLLYRGKARVCVAVQISRSLRLRQVSGEVPG